MVNIDGTQWESLDLYKNTLHHLIHSMNNHQLNQKRPFFVDLIKRQEGREAKLGWTYDGSRLQYYLPNGVRIPEGYWPPEIPNAMQFPGYVFVGGERPMRDAQSIPPEGAIWLKLQDEFDQSGHRIRTRIKPLVSTGHGYADLGGLWFGQLKFNSESGATEAVANIRARLGQHVGERLSALHPKGVRPTYTFDNLR